MGHILYNSGPTGGQQNIGGVGFLACKSGKQTPHVVKFDGPSERLSTILVDYQGTRFGICAAYVPPQKHPHQINLRKSFIKTSWKRHSNEWPVTATASSEFNCPLCIKMLPTNRGIVNHCYKKLWYSVINGKYRSEINTGTTTRSSDSGRDTPAVSLSVWGLG